MNASIAIRWSPVVIDGFSTNYRVSTEGRIESECYGQWNELSLQRTPKGYLRVALRMHGRVRMSFVHRIVATAFIGQSNGRQVNHKNGIKDDNRVANLEWVTCQQNAAHAFDCGLRKKLPLGAYRRKLTDKQAESVRQLHSRGVTREFMSRWFGVTKQCIGNIVRNKTYVAPFGLGA